MKELYRVAGAIVPSEDVTGFVVPYYRKDGNGLSTYLAKWDESTNRIYDFKEFSNSQYMLIPTTDEFGLIGVDDFQYSAIAVRDVSKHIHIIIGVDMADSFQRLIKLSKCYLLDSEAFLWAERQKYICFIKKIDGCFIQKVLENDINKKVSLIDSMQKISPYWQKFIFPMYNLKGNSLSNSNVNAFCFESDDGFQYLAVHLKMDMALHVHLLDVTNFEKPQLVKSNFWQASFYAQNSWKRMLNDTFDLFSLYYGNNI